MLQFEGTDPLVIIAPAIDWKLDFVFDKKTVNGNSFLSISGKIQGKGFPAYECFIADRDNNRIFIHTYSCPKKLDLAVELGDPRYDYQAEIKLLIEIDENGLFKKQAHSKDKIYTVDAWNEINWKRKPAPDCE